MKTVIEMARAAGMNVVDDQYSLLPFLERFAELARADERQVCMDAINALPYQRSTKYDCMDAIRARGETK